MGFVEKYGLSNANDDVCIRFEDGCFPEMLLKYPLTTEPEIRVDTTSKYSSTVEEILRGQNFCSLKIFAGISYWKRKNVSIESYL